ncbi:MAG: UDP-N-acetylmuramate--L-alanine ligase [Deltaproteobacteria bacterium]|nr:UDP-N-acetylmuramate--L-alanine ligase [Deltaproteobacteria bacterium]
MYRGKINKIHFIGIGGSGMSGIAEVLLNMGYSVSGSDMADTAVTKRLAGLGAKVFKGHAGENVKGVDCVVYSSAVKADNPEVVEAVRAQIPVIPRAEMLAELMRLKYGIAIGGTHGKTTTTSMVATVLGHAGMDPTVVTGGKLNSIGANAKLGGGDFLVAEADESDGSFLKLSPTITVVTNIDKEHMNYYSDMESVKKAYLEFLNKVPFYGLSVVCLDHPVLQELLPGISRRHITYGLSAQAEVRAVDITQEGGKTSFTVVASGVELGRVTLKMPGAHNATNALACVCVAMELGIDTKKILEGLESFKGVERRFQVKGEVGGVTVVDDYGHHPVEIRAVLRAIKDNWKRRAIVAFQPHRHSRTEELFMEFVTAFNDADALVMTGIYAAGEEPRPGVSAEKLCKAIKDHGHRSVECVGSVADVPGVLEKIVKQGDMVITLGAGDIWKAGEKFLELLKTGKGA